MQTPYMSIELVRGGGRFKSDPKRKEPRGRDSGRALQMIRTKQEWDLLAKAASVDVNKSTTTTILFSPITSLRAKSPTVRHHLVINPQIHSDSETLLNSAISPRCCCSLLPPSHCCASFHCPARPLRFDTNPRATRQSHLALSQPQHRSSLHL
jgi:hypothetical protein